MRVLILIGLLFIIPSTIYAIEDTAVLPKGVRSMLWKQGYVGAVTEKYGTDATLYSLDGRLTKNFDAKQVLNLHPRAPELINALNNTLLKGYGLGDKIQLGQLQFSGEANLQYMAPVIAYGLTDKWTVAFVTSFAKIDADIEVQHTGVNNSKQIYDAISSKGKLNDEADATFKRLMNLDLRSEFYTYLENKNYKPLKTNPDWQFGDVQLVSKYKYFETPKWTLLNKVVVNLPTGPEDDPSDFLDLPIFHRSFVEVTQVQDYQYTKNLVFGSALTYIWNIADKIDRRVPVSASDYLPDASRQENVDRDIGDGLRWELNTRYNLNSNVSFASAYVGNYKVKDYYSGNRSYDYSILSKNTETYYHRYELQANYSAVQDYLNKKSPIPYSVSYKFSDLFSGKNIERQTVHELTLMVFF
ncbi:MAG: hypothetical protein KDD37_07585 [Bdellovibrionales bacterium]|nr:hypothetical protein [Bdellovibrionales bacterium]